MNYQRSGATFIDPKNCGSIVAYRIWITEWHPKDKPVEYGVSASVTLSDCNRQINWDFSNDNDCNESDSLEKIDKAIDILKQFRKELVATSKYVKQLTSQASK